MLAESRIDRRRLLGLCAGAAAAAVSPSLLADGRAPAAPRPRGRKLKQSVCRWVLGKTPLDELCRRAKDIGVAGIDLLREDEWAIPSSHGLACTMAYGPKGMQIGRGLNRREHHDEFVRDCEVLIPRIADAGIPNMIVFSGNRGGQDDEEGIGNCTEGLKRLAEIAEKRGVTLCMELLNSKVDHRDYAFDRMEYGVRVCEGVGSGRVKILYDIYHAQVMEGDVIRTIRTHARHIGHFHTAGVPGRRDLDEDQELYYPAICRAILETGFDGWLAHEFAAKEDPFAALARAVRTCDV
ncbi:MAG: TIM barrel protein [Planctomycetota bacterium]